MLEDIENKAFLFYAVDKSKWVNIIYSAADLMEAIRALPDDKEGTDRKATALHEASELLSASFFNIVDRSNYINIDGSDEFFDKFLPRMKQDEECLKAEHAGWDCILDYPSSFGTIDMQSLTDIKESLATLLSMPADELAKQVKSVDYVVRLYDMISKFRVKEDQIIVWYTASEDESWYDPWDD